jgi:hypothetical protein
VKLLTEDAKLVCAHRSGKVSIAAIGQKFVAVEGRLILVATDPEGRSISGCASMGPGIRPCVTTLVVEAGYSEWLRIDGKRVCLDTVTGLTDGSPPGTIHYLVVDPGQTLVSEA